MKDSRWVIEVLDEFEAPLMRYAVSLLGDLDRARDVVQDTFLKLCEQNREAVRDHLAQWLFTVCRNRAVDLLRKEGRMNAMTAEARRILRDPSPGPAARLEQKESLTLVARLMDALSENQQEVIRLKFQSGLSYKEISKITGLSVSNVGFLIHTAVKKMREEMEQARLRSVRRVQ